MIAATPTRRRARILRRRVLAALLIGAGLLASGLALAAQPTLSVPPGLMLCGTAAEVARPDHAGCWFARGGQRIARINPAVTWSQLIVWSTDGRETVAVYALRTDTDRLQMETAR